MRRSLSRNATVILALFALLLCFPSASSAQRQANIWHFGDRAGLDFNTPPATAAGPAEVTTSAMTAAEGVAVECDRVTGQLLFYSNGIRVYDRTNSAMPGADGTDTLGGGFSSTQAILSVPDPGNANRYYLFTTPDFGSGSAEFNVVDMTGRGGLGDVTVRRQPLPSPGGIAPPAIVSEKVAATHDAAGTGYWVLFREFATKGGSTNALYAYHLSAAGIDGVTVSRGGTMLLGLMDFALGEMKFSPDGHWLAVSHETRATDLFTFNNATGSLSFITTLPETYGLSFSPNSRLLYMNSGTITTADPIIQFSLSDPSPVAIATSAVTIGTSLTEQLGSMQIAPDGRIYVAKNGQGSLGVITAPDVHGTGCGYINTGFILTGGRRSLLGLPNLILEPLPLHEYSICAGSSVQIGLEPQEGSIYTWVPATGLSCNDCSSPVAAPRGSTTYHLIVARPDGSRANDSLTVTVDTLLKGVAAHIGRDYHVRPGEMVVAPVILDGSVGTTLIDTVTFTLGYRGSILRLMDFTTEGTLLQGWSTDIIRQEDGIVSLRLRAPPGGYLSGDGHLADLTFLTFLGDTIASELPLTVDLAGPDGGACTVIASGPGLIRLDSVCGMGLRLMDVSASKYSLGQNSPNPFNPTTEIDFSLGLDGYTTLTIYNALGGRVATLLEGWMQPGSYRVSWDATAMPSGLYYYRLNSGTWSRINSMILRK